MKHGVDRAAEGKPQIAFILPNLSGGGAERMTLNLIPALRAQGYAPFLILSNHGGELSAAIGADLEVVSLGASHSWRSLGPLIRLLRERRPAAVISALGHTNVVTILAARLAGVKTRVFVRVNGVLSNQARESADWRQALLPLMYRAVARFADGVIAVSEGARRDFMRATGVKPEHVRVIYNPVLRPTFQEEVAAPVDHPFFRPGGPPVFVSVGRLVPVKDPKTLLKAFALLRARRAARLALVGDGEMRAELGELAAQLGIADDVAFVGFQDNPIRFIARAAALVVTSRHEGFGNVIVEALAAGTPVVSTDCPYGPAEILEDGRYGRLAPIGDAEAIASAMEEVLDAPPQREASLARGWQFTASDIAARYAEALATVGVAATVRP